MVYSFLRGSNLYCVAEITSKECKPLEDLEIYNRMQEIIEAPQFAEVFGENDEMARKIAAHRSWLRSIRHERPSTGTHYKIGIYIRYFNQTKYENYLSYHKKQFRIQLRFARTGIWSTFTSTRAQQRRTWRVRPNGVG